jgi:putative tricarboxylic transport membrane protein
MTNSDRFAGALFMVLGGVGLYFAFRLPFGSLKEIGSGFLPVLTFAGLLVIGAVKFLLSFVQSGADLIELLPPRPLCFVTAAFILFGLFIERLGLAIALAAMLAAVEFAGTHKKSVLSFLLLLCGLTAFAVLVFTQLLGIPMQVMPKWN